LKLAYIICFAACKLNAAERKESSFPLVGARNDASDSESYVQGGESDCVLILLQTSRKMLSRRTVMTKADKTPMNEYQVSIGVLVHPNLTVSRKSYIRTN
jgi:hypothetical protein